MKARSLGILEMDKAYRSGLVVISIQGNGIIMSFMGKENTFGTLEVIMKVNFKMIDVMVMGLKTIQTEPFMQAIGIKVKKKELERKPLKVVTFTKASLKKIKDMESVTLNILMVTNIQVTGMKEASMDLEHIIFQMEISIKETSSIIKWKAWESTLGQMVISTLVNLKTRKNMVMESSNGRQEKNTKAITKMVKRKVQESTQ